MNIQMVVEENVETPKKGVRYEGKHLSPRPCDPGGKGFDSWVLLLYASKLYSFLKLIRVFGLTSSSD